MNPRLTILRKGLILIAVPLLFQVVFIALLTKMRQDGAWAVDWTIHTKDVIAQAQTSRVVLLKAHGEIQGYIITGDPSYAEALNRSIARAPSEIAAVRSLVVDRADQSRAALELERQITQFLAFMNEGRGMVRDHRMDAGQAVTRRRLSQGMLDALETNFDHFVDFERYLDDIRQSRMIKSRADLNALLAAGLAASVVATVFLAIIFARNISGRIASLTENTHRLAEGKELMPPIKGGDEIAVLDHVFHEMARTLAESAAREKQHATVLEHRAEELKVVNGQLREKAQENEMFVYSVSHDLRSPLVNLQGFSKELGMIGKDLGRLVDHDQIPPETRKQARVLIESEMAESIGFIQTAVSRLSGIIDGLLRLSRAGQVEYRSQSVESGPIVARVVAALRGTIDGRNATVEVGELPPAWGDPTAIEQVFANLIGNAINYLDKNRPGKIEVFAIDPDEAEGPVEGITPGSVVFAVRDNGLGISDAYKTKVFAVFQRLHGDVAKGEGVGLALVRRVVERHGGRVWFKSKPGEGSTFFVALPSTETHAVQSGELGDDDLPLISTRSGNGRDAGWQPSR